MEATRKASGRATEGRGRVDAWARVVFVRCRGHAKARPGTGRPVAGRGVRTGLCGLPSEGGGGRLLDAGHRAQHVRLDGADLGQQVVGVDGHTGGGAGLDGQAAATASRSASEISAVWIWGAEFITNFPSLRCTAGGAAHRGQVTGHGRRPAASPFGDTHATGDARITSRRTPAFRRPPVIPTGVEQVVLVTPGDGHEPPPASLQPCSLLQLGVLQGVEEGSERPGRDGEARAVRQFTACRRPLRARSSPTPGPRSAGSCAAPSRRSGRTPSPAGGRSLRAGGSSHG